MIRNFIRLAWRNLLANKVYSAINIIGLAVGLAVCILLMLYISDETGYDRHHKGADRLYRINTAFKNKVDQGKSATSNALLAAGLLKDLPEVEQAGRLLSPFFNSDALVIEHTEGARRKDLFVKNAYYVDSTFFDLFNYNFVAGDGRTALRSPNTAVLSADFSRKLFGAEDPMGKSIVLALPNGNFTYKVNGVFRPAGPSHINAAVFLSMKNQDFGLVVDNISNWATNNIFLTYIRLKAGTDPVAFEQKLNPFLRRHGAADIDAAGAERLLSMEAVEDIHLHSHLPYDVGENGSITYLYILGSVALFMLIIACVNFMNLSTARSQKRAREVGVRKVIGALKGSIMLQFLGESVLLSTLALVVALLLVQVFLPVFNTFAHKQLALLQHPAILYWIGALTLLTGLLAGVYPAFYLSSFRPIKVLKGQLVNSLSASFFRKGLVVFQFSISIFLILACFITWQQLHYMQQRDLGFNKDQQLVLPLLTQEAAGHYELLKDEIAKNTRVISVAGGNDYPGTNPHFDTRFYTDGKTVADGASVILGPVKYGYLETLGMKLMAGRVFSPDYPSDSSAIILNETALQKLGLDATTAVGTTIHFDKKKQRFDSHVIGIVHDFNFKGLQEPIKPYGFILDRNTPANLFVHVNTADYGTLLAELENSWKRINPGSPFEYTFIDKDFERNYTREYTTARIIGGFTVLTILIACLGLFGLAAFTAEQRVREIGIRKVLGCTVGGIATLLSRDFIRLVLLAILIASPLAWWGMHHWLNDFAYRISIQWWVFPAAGGLSIGIAFLTIGSQAIRAALANPVKSLRSE